MKRHLDYFWPVFGLSALAYSVYRLFHGELKNLSLGDVEQSLSAISLHHWLFAVGASLIAYAALAWYDRIALMHLGHKLGWRFISIVSFTTYALSHNIGASVFSGAVVRYRAYSTKGLSLSEVGLLVAFTAFTFALGTIFLGGIVLLFEPEVMLNIIDLPLLTLRLIGVGMIGFIALYLLGSALRFPPLKIRSRSLPAIRFGRFNLGKLATPAINLDYPEFGITLRQLMAGPLELLGAAAIIYFALPEAGNPGFFTILGVFLASFSAALISHAPGGLGVLEFVFVKALPDASRADIVAALLVWRFLYLILPLALAIVTVLLFERQRLADKLRHMAHHREKK